jgi:PadR family transcriptional regulator PadR
MSGSLKVSRSAQAVLIVFLDDPASSRYGLELCRLIGMTPGTLYPVLARLETEGWLTSDWEAPGPDRVDAPRRRRYRITRSGMENATRVGQLKSRKRSWERPYLPLPGWAQ